MCIQFSCIIVCLLSCIAILQCYEQYCHSLRIMPVMVVKLIFSCFMSNTVTSHWRLFICLIKLLQGVCGLITGLVLADASSACLTTAHEFYAAWSSNGAQTLCIVKFFHDVSCLVIQWVWSSVCWLFSFICCAFLQFLLGLCKKQAVENLSDHKSQHFFFFCFGRGNIAIF